MPFIYILYSSQWSFPSCTYWLISLMSYLLTLLAILLFIQANVAKIDNTSLISLQLSKFLTFLYILCSLHLYGEKNLLLSIETASPWISWPPPNLLLFLSIYSRKLHYFTLSNPLYHSTYIHYPVWGYTLAHHHLFSLSLFPSLTGVSIYLLNSKTPFSVLLS